MSSRRQHLMLVRSLPREARQLELFSRTSLLAVVNLADATGDTFHGLVRRLRPTVIIDLRPVPRFDFGTLNRRAVFGMFSAAGTAYVDMSGRLGVTSHRDARLNPVVLAEEIDGLLDALGKKCGPLVLFLDDSDQVDATARLLPGQLSLRHNGAWEARILDDFTGSALREA